MGTLQSPLWLQRDKDRPETTSVSSGMTSNITPAKFCSLQVTAALPRHTELWAAVTGLLLLPEPHWLKLAQAPKPGLGVWIGRSAVTKAVPRHGVTGHRTQGHTMSPQKSQDLSGCSHHSASATWPLPTGPGHRSSCSDAILSFQRHLFTLNFGGLIWDWGFGFGGFWWKNLQSPKIVKIKITHEIHLWHRSMDLVDAHSASWAIYEIGR